MLSDVRVIRPRPGAAVVELRGEHDLDTCDELHALLSGLVRENEVVVIEVSGAEFIDSSVLRNLVQAAQLARKRRTQVRVQLGTAPIVRKALELTGLLDALDCVEGREEALADAAVRRHEADLSRTPYQASWRHRAQG